MKDDFVLRTVANGKVKELDRDRLLENLDYLLSWEMMTQAELESAAGVYNGYISRMKSDPRKLPALDAIWKMAQVLGVSLEWIIQGTDRNLDENILYIRRFLQKLFDRTVAGKMVWKRYSYGLLNRILAGRETVTDLPCVEPKPEGGFRAFSLAFDDTDNSFTEAAFTTWIDERHILCISRMKYEELIESEDQPTLNINEFVELQTMDVVTGERSLVACSSRGGNEWLEEDVEKLYKQLLEHGNDLTLGPALRSMIDAFMNRQDDLD